MKRKKHRSIFGIDIGPDLSGMGYQPIQEGNQEGYVLPSVNIGGEYIPDGGMLPEVEVVGDPYEITDDMPWYAKLKKKFQRGWSNVMNTPTMAYVPGGSGYYPSFPTVPSTVGQDLSVAMAAAMPFAGASAAVGIPTTAYGLGNFASRDGFDKTLREYRKGNYGSGTLSLAGDIFNVLPAGIGAHGLYNAPVVGQYPRYIGGKIIYGLDAKLPTVYRKLGDIPEVVNGKVTLTNTPSRFRYIKTGDDPMITNSSTDVGVRSHGNNNWDDMDMIATPGESLLGKRVVSTRPSDTFTEGSPVTVKVKDVHYLSGNKENVAKAEASGYKTYTSQRLQDKYKSSQSAYEDAMSAYSARKGKGRIELEKEPRRGDYFPEYARVMEEETRSLFRSPTKKDYDFMDYVFRPEYKSDLTPFVRGPITTKDAEMYPEIGKMTGNGDKMKYLNDPTYWENVMYDPVTDAEFLWREKNGIELLEKIPKEIQESWKIRKK